jgi:hypothetical protein
MWHPWIINFVESFIRSSLDNSIDNSKDNNFISKPNCFSFFLITTSYPYHSSSLPTNMDMKREINMCLFMSKIFILIQTKFDIDINNDEPLEPYENIQKSFKNSSLSLVVQISIEPKLNRGV